MNELPRVLAEIEIYRPEYYPFFTQLKDLIQDILGKVSKKEEIIYMECEKHSCKCDSNGEIKDNREIQELKKTFPSGKQITEIRASYLDLKCSEDNHNCNKLRDYRWEKINDEDKF